ncbi:hypothetical protein EN836_28070 [Mesorhizobium sp. M1C.F.Ca.ET.193.01.1.1]|uniref:hypothetical protein n=1 Tax=unclassified Mesorhizobium TaxID=325217 RepID=UPI000FD198FF|nr:MULTISPECIES: hypothetical protein [unclassified Mesorhizobium]TGS93320.1 hypothetical protein EN820_48730 [bacterium M00.F.Ca.ET.177.01.1.1]TGQ50597.1 hypothetical protein EN853_28060 [Mesorhizobium sp. M1C.F.Ca.ET.210.01.1.1]TGQ65768.1 hypothetical protein EN855_028075 [Mesorhizobium sp. M1C.F.Ca.ET.212.01.1.1]TGQ99713.1 hypothetical protein EN847_28060 [Mesorhizobium sp. M1C.F.Ca.ET.204.01.1.1]TGR20129.1 hypothetical protein EN839_28060 [Mesorhizobium sp. M1C.F.Ca.ET.196.01.1.1]
MDAQSPQAAPVGESFSEALSSPVSGMPIRANVAASSTVHVPATDLSRLDVAAQHKILTTLK